MRPATSRRRNAPLCLRLDVDGVEFSDAAEQQHTVDARVDEMIKVLAPIIVVNGPIRVRDGDGRAEHAFELGVASHDIFLSTIW